MDHPLVTALNITAIGMSLLFLALVFFYGLMSFMMSVVHRRQASPETAETPVLSPSDTIVKQAAAIAVALARAEAEQEETGHMSPTRARADVMPAPSPWWVLHHQRQMAAPQSLRRTR